MILYEPVTKVNLNDSLGSMGIMISLATQLHGNKDFASVCILNAIQSNVPAESIIETIKGMIEDNNEGMKKLLGLNLTEKILAI